MPTIISTSPFSIFRRVFHRQISLRILSTSILSTLASLNIFCVSSSICSTPTPRSFRFSLWHFGQNFGFMFLSTVMTFHLVSSFVIRHHHIAIAAIRNIATRFALYYISISSSVVQIMLCFFLKIFRILSIKI